MRRWDRSTFPSGPKNEEDFPEAQPHQIKNWEERYLTMQMGEDEK
jgi:hypothetical protein